MAGTVLSVLAGGVLWFQAPTPPTHVVLVIVCTMRKDQLTPYGGHKRVTPGLSRLATTGALFESAYDAAPWTKAASTALWTGKHAVTIGMTEPSDQRNLRILPEQETTLAEHLHDAGYFTAGVTGNPNTSATFGFDQGFDEYHSGKLWSDGGGHPSGTQVIAALLQQLDEAPADKPVFLQAMMLDPHEPIKVSREEFRPFTEEGLPKHVAKYRAALHQTDNTISQLWTALSDRGYTPENTLRIVVNDHGEGLKWPNHHGKGHGNMTYQSTVAMPWILNGPGVAQDHRIGGVASQVDLVPTVLGLLGLEGYEGPGRDWTAQVGGVARTDRTWAYVDTWFRQSSKAAIYSEAQHCHRNFSKREGTPDINCYDIAEDPNALRPLPLVDPAMSAALQQWRAQGVTAATDYPHTREAKLSSTEKQMLEALGYTEHGEGVPEPKRRPKAEQAAPQE